MSREWESVEIGSCEDLELSPSHRDLLRRKLAAFGGHELCLPTLTWKWLASGVVWVSLFCVATERSDSLNRLRDRLVEHLAGRTSPFIVSAFCLPFRLPALSRRPLLFAEFRLRLHQDRDLRRLESAMQAFEASLAVEGVRGHQELVTSGFKRRWLHAQIGRLIERFPDQVGPKAYLEAHAFLTLTSEEFRAIRKAPTLVRAIGSLYAVKTHILREMAGLPKERALRLRLLVSQLDFPFGSKRVLGMAVALSLEDPRERLDKEHVYRAIHRVIPEMRPVPGSYVSYSCGDSTTVSLYVEAERIDGKAIDRRAWQRLRQPLEEELLQSVERRVNSVHLHRNEADIQRNIQTLAKELQKKRDLPHVIIEFHKQERGSLTFTVILARVVSAESELLARLMERLAESVEVIPDSQKILDRCDGCCKEAAVFGVRLRKERFLRRDQSIDLHKARQYVAEHLSDVLGEVRDYNGGLILKQNEVLMAVKKALSSSERSQEELLDSLFYGLVPRVVQSYIEPQLVYECFRMVLRALKTPHQGHEACLIEVSLLPSALLIVLEGKEGSFRREILQAVEGLGLDPLRLAHSLVEAQESSLLSLVFRCDNDAVRRQLIQTVQGSLRKWREGLRQQQRLRISLPVEITALDPRIHTQRRHGVLMKMFFEGLMRLNKWGRPALALAEHVDISSDRRTYVFHLRESYWTNKRPVTAGDFVYAWKRAVAPTHVGFHAYLFFPICNFEAIQKGEKEVDALAVWAEGERRLCVQLEYPAPYFLDLAAHWCYSPVCEGIDELCPDWAFYERNAYVCNGPFMPAESSGQWRLRAIRNPTYWDAKSVKLDEIDVAVVQQPATAWNLYKHNLLDWIGEPLSEPPIEVMRSKMAGGSLQTGHLGAIHWYELNVESKPFTSKKVRRACALAINRERLARDVLNGWVEPVLGFLPAESALATDLQLLRGDKFLARRLFEEGMQEIGCDPEELAPIVLKHGLYEEHRAIAAYVAREWEETLGIRLEMEYVPRLNYAELVTSLNFQVAAVTWYSWYRDPSYNLMHLRKRSWFLNCTQWEHSEYARLLDAANHCLDLGQRRLLLRQAEELLLEEMPIVPICGQKHSYIKRESVKDVIVTELGLIDFKHAYVQEERPV